MPRLDSGGYLRWQASSPGGTWSPSEAEAEGQADSRPWGLRAGSGMSELEFSGAVSHPTHLLGGQEGTSHQVQKVEPHDVAGGDQARETRSLLGYEFRPKQPGAEPSWVGSSEPSPGGAILAFRTFYLFLKPPARKKKVLKTTDLENLGFSRPKTCKSQEFSVYRPLPAADGNNYRPAFHGRLLRQAPFCTEHPGRAPELFSGGVEKGVKSGDTASCCSCPCNFPGPAAVSDR